MIIFVLRILAAIVGRLRKIAKVFRRVCYFYFAVTLNVKQRIIFGGRLKCEKYVQVLIGFF